MRLTLPAVLVGLTLVLVGCDQQPQTPPVPPPAPRQPTSFADFDARATEGGKPMTVVFLGGSLTWGANSSDPQKTSYRALMADYLREKYPKTSFHFIDASIGGTGSNLGLFRLERDVLAYHPDLVFLDFTANDDPTSNNPKSIACYEQLLRTMIGDGIPVEQVYFGFKFNFGPAYKLDQLKGYRKRLKLADSYQTAAGDLFAYLQPKLEKGELDIEKLWPFDGAHPDDAGYQVFFEAARHGFEEAIQKKLVCTVPDKPVYSDEFHTYTRLKLVDTTLPLGWARTPTYRTSAWFDGLSSRWMGDVAMCDSKDKATIQPIKVDFTGTLLGVFGEADENGLDFKATVDGQVIPFQPDPKKPGVEGWPFNLKMLGHGKLMAWRLVTTNLKPGHHMLEIMPVIPDAPKSPVHGTLTPSPTRQLRIESICTAGD